MSNYRRVRLQGGTYFFIVNLLVRQRSLLVEHIGILGDAFRLTREKLPFETIAIVVLPENDDDYSSRWLRIKSEFSRKIELDEYRSKARSKKRERGIWQRRFWEHTIIHEDDLMQHINYAYINPLKHGYVTRVCDWPHSSFHRDVRLGIYPENWAG